MPRASNTTKKKSPSSARIAFGRAFRYIREERGMTGKEYGNLIFRSQSYISKLETGEILPDSKTLDEMILRIHASEREENLLRAAYEFVNTPSSLYASIRIAGHANKQKSIRDLESTISNFREYEIGLIPGLIQTSDYTARILDKLSIPPDVIRDVAEERFLRQRILSDQSRSFTFVLIEQLLHMSDEFDDVALEQLAYIKQLSLFSNIDIGIIPLEKGIHPEALTGFIIYDEKYVTCETVASEQFFSNPREIAVYASTFEKLASIALFGEEARELINGIIDRNR